MASREQRTEPRPAPRLYLVTPRIGDPAGFRCVLADALRAADVPAVLLRMERADERTLINRIKALAPVVQQAGTALLLNGDANAAVLGGADGVHVSGVEAFREALPIIKPERILGCGGLETRHDAMIAAESDADYVMFGEPADDGRRPALDATVERVAWWAEVFQVPCVAYAADAAEVAPLAAAGADFVALGEWVFSNPRDAASLVADAARQLALAEPVP